jgi:hypothetical protein
VEEDVRRMMEKLATFRPDRVTTLVALAATGIVAVIVLAIAGAPWYAYGLVMLLLAATFVASIKWPHVRMEGEQLYKYVSDQFSGRRDAVQSEDDTQEATGGGNLDTLRVAEYERTRGLFLVHSWRPSEDRSQVADVVIRLQEHRDTSTRPSLLAEGRVESVKYELGRRFFEEPRIKRNRGRDFALEVSAYRPMLCLAEVRFNDGPPPVYLSRYIDFPTEP